MRFRPVLAIMLILSLLLGIQAPASAATTEIEDQQMVADGNDGLWINSSQWGAQTFTAGKTGTLTRVDLYLQSVSGQIGVKVEIRAVDTGTGAPIGGQQFGVAGVALASATATATNAGGWAQATFASPTTVTQGARYAIVVGLTCIVSCDVRWEMRSDATTDSYTGGAAWWTLSGEWRKSQTAFEDYLFKTWVTVDELDQAQTTSNASTGAYSNQWLAQTFTAGKTGDLTRVRLRLQGPVFATTMTVQIRTVANGIPTGSDQASSGTILASKQYQVTYTPTLYWHEVVFDTPVPIVAGAQYAIVVGNSHATADFVFRWSQHSGNPYAGGGAYWTVQGVWNASQASTHDFAFETYVVAHPDTTPPVITPTIVGTLGTNGWYTSDVTVNWSVVDAESDITSSSGCDATTITSDTTGTTLTCEATSAGGTASQSVTIQRDATAPTLAPSVSPNPVLLNGTATASPNASDTTSGIASQSCAAVATSSVGSKTVSCTATDNAGNTTTTSASYQVHYAFSGFQAPVNPNALNVAKAGQAIPLKFRITDAHGNPVTTLTAVSVASVAVTCGSVSALSDPVEEYATGKSGLQNLGDGYYQFNWSTPKTYANTCRQLQLTLSDGQTYTANFHFKK
jgi:hypothetical protein